jgi:5-carboxymethyl-2-hydroxymuconate isomerase
MEYTSSVEDRVNIQLLLEQLHQTVMECGLFEPDSVKSRAIRCHQWLLGEFEDSEDFIHVTFELLSGRSDESKSELSRVLADVIQKQASTTKSITVNIRDMDRGCFEKVIN